VLELRYLSDETPTLTDVGRVLGVSHQRAQQIEARALRRVREALGAAGQHDDQAIQRKRKVTAEYKQRQRERMRRYRKRRRATKVLQTWERDADGGWRRSG